STAAGRAAGAAGHGRAQRAGGEQSHAAAAGGKSGAGGGAERVVGGHRGAVGAEDLSMRRRVLYVHNSADIYGASRSLLRLLARVEERGNYEAMVLLPEEGPLRARLEALGVEVVVDQWLTVITRSALRPAALLKLLLAFPISVWRVRRRIVRHKMELV